MKKVFFAFAFIAAFSLAAMGQGVTARAAARGTSRGGQNALSAPHACTLEHGHPCVYYGGDINLSDPNANGGSNENDNFISQSFSYAEVNSPKSATVSGAFSNNLASFGILDPKTATWHFRSGVSEGNGGTLLGSGDSPALITDTGRNDFGFEEYEVVTATRVAVPKGDVWFNVTPDCTNPNDPECGADDPRYFESDTDGTLNAINGKYTVTSNNGFGDMFDSEIFFGAVFQSWCNDQGVMCGEGFSAGVLQ
ncbi:MAG: hypothetical protein WBM11_01235 [Terriglobales bacterium]